MKKISAIMLALLISLMSVVPVFASASEAEVETEAEVINLEDVTEYEKLNTGAYDLDLSDVDPNLYYTYVYSDQYGSSDYVDPYGVMTISLDDEITEQSDMSLYSNVEDSDVSASSEMFSEMDFTNYTDDVCDPLNMYDPNYVNFFEADKTVHPQFDLTENEFGFSIVNRNMCAYDAYQLICKYNVWEYAYENFSNCYVVVDPYQDGGYLYYTVGVYGIPKSTAAEGSDSYNEQIARQAFVYNFEDGGLYGHYTYALRTIEGYSPVWNGTRADKGWSTLSQSYNAGMAGGDDLDILGSKLVFSTSDIHGALDSKITSFYGYEWEDLTFYSGAYFPTSPDSLEYFSPRDRQFATNFGDYTDLGTTKNIGTIKKMKYRKDVIMSSDNTEVTDIYYTFNWENEYPDYLDDYYVECYANVIAEVDGLVFDRSYETGLIKFATVPYSSLSAKTSFSTLQSTSAYKAYKLKVALDHTNLLTFTKVNESFDFYFRIMKVDNEAKTYKTGNWSVLTFDRTDYDNPKWFLTNGYMNGDGEYIPTDNISTVTESMGVGKTEEEAGNNTVVEGTTGAADSGAGDLLGGNIDSSNSFGSGADYIAHFDEVMSIVGSFPFFVASLVTWLPSWYFFFMGFALVLIVVLRILGR